MATSRAFALRTGLVLVLLVALAGCSSQPRRSAQPPARSDAVVVASFNFDESRLLAEIYSQALAHAGIPVRVELHLGPRELVRPALRQPVASQQPRRRTGTVHYLR